MSAASEASPPLAIIFTDVRCLIAVFIKRSQTHDFESSYPLKHGKHPGQDNKILTLSQANVGPIQEL